MANDGSANVTIIRRKKVVAGGHHGGAWKVAYADFVTAMMAFFLLMWLLAVSDQSTREGLAEYFTPSIPLFETSGGGDGPFEGDSMFSQDTLAKDGTGGVTDAEAEAGGAASDQSLWDVAEQLQGGSGDALDADPMLQQIATRVTDEGLIIDVFDIEGSPLFDAGSAQGNAIFSRLVGMIGRVLSHVENPIAISGHLATGDLIRKGDSTWVLSSDRAHAARKVLVEAGVGDLRLQRVTGKADRDPLTDVPTDGRNRRLEIVLLRQFPQTAEAGAARR